MMSYTLPHVCSWTRNVKDAQLKVAPYTGPCDRDKLRDLINNAVPPLKADVDNECRHKSMIENYLDKDIGRLFLYSCVCLFL